MRELKVEDALLYLDQVKVEFGDRPHIYNEFLDIMKTFKTQQIDTPGVIRRVSNLFQGNRKLVLGFNTFLPEGYKIEIPADGPPVAVYRPPGSNVTHILRESAESQAVSVAQAVANANRMSAQQQRAAAPLYPSPQTAGNFMNPNLLPPVRQEPPQQQQQRNTAKMLLPSDAGGVAPRPQAEVQQQQQNSVLGRPQHLPGGVAPRQLTEPQGRGRPNSADMLGQQPPPQQPQPPPQQQQDQGFGVPLEFDHAINYVTTIKRRFASEPGTYQKFLEILHTYQKEQRGIKEVLDEVSDLFDDHPDLLKEFTYFLPDAVQAQAKIQLEAMAKEAEIRKRQKAKNAIMNQAQGMQAEAQTMRQQQSRKPATQEIHTDRQATPSGGIAYSTNRTQKQQNDISQGAQYGTVSFEPTRPPKKNEPTPAMLALKNGRPTSIPTLPVKPDSREELFFARAKAHLNRRELLSEKPSVKRHNPYNEFLKCLHLFGAGVLSKDELTMFMRSLFTQGHAPKTGSASVASLAARDPDIHQDAQELIQELEELMVGRGPYADQEMTIKANSKYGTLRPLDFDFAGVASPTPSYRKLPSDFPSKEFYYHPGQTQEMATVLNDSCVCVDPFVVGEVSDGSGKTRGSQVLRKRKAISIEESDGSQKRHNAYEQTLARIEDDRFELDMAIERNLHALRRIEPFAKECEALRLQEEKDGQPIGRLRYNLYRYSLNTIHINAIARVYGDRGDEILQHLMRNPLIALPVVYERLKQKDDEWKKVRANLNEQWKMKCQANYEGSMDVQCYSHRRALEKSFASHRLLDQCKRVRSFIKHPEKLKEHPATDAFAPWFGRQVIDSGAVFYQPFVATSCGVTIAHRYAFQAVAHWIKSSDIINEVDREKIGRIWAEFVVPWFGYPSYWMIDEVRESFTGILSPNVTKCTSFVVLGCLFWLVSYSYNLFSVAPGQRVQTVFGEGIVQSFVDSAEDAGPRYRVKLPFGLGHLSPSAILYAIPTKDSPYIRRDGMMVRDGATLDDMDFVAPSIESKYQLLFGTEKIYLFMRIYNLLCAVLSDTYEALMTSPEPADPAESYVCPSNTKRIPMPKLDFSNILVSLKGVLANKIDANEFESMGRLICKNRIHQIAALPKLVQRCSEALVKVADEDTLLNLWDYCQFRGANPVAVRQQCLSIVPDAFYRIQMEDNKCIFYGYMDHGPLLTAPKADHDVEEAFDTGTGDEPMDIDLEHMNGDNGKSIDEPAAKRMKLDE